MLFVSRRIGFTSDEGRRFKHMTYGVVDTDDGVETVVTYEDIDNACRLGLDIKGVVDDDIRPYQNPSMRTALQVKARVMYHVDMVIYKSEIADLVFNWDEIKHPVRIRLSDFGNVLGYNALLFNQPPAHAKVSLVFDDNIKFNPESLDMPGVEDVRNVVFDIREVTDQETRSSIYKALYENMYWGEVRDCVLDSEEGYIRAKARLGEG